ncbi:SLBB domain-containing protein [Marinomonas sp. PE14-40]|uniref:SLBB domain-containing protein n=1 Tax=Marinomonas sp. PE14-40 TaxID=3060621 RepID=UPI003F668185
MKSSIKLWLILIIMTISQAVMANSQHTLRPGDVLNLKFPGEAEFNDTFQLDPQGYVTLPEVGSLFIEGMNPPQAQAFLIRRLSVVYRDLSKFELFLVERRLSVMVLGFVQTPGEIDLPQNSNVQMAINKAGGLSQGAQLDKLQIRRGEQTIQFDYKQYLDTGNQNVLPALQPKDVIFVPASPLIGNVQVDFDARTLTAAGDASGQESIKVFGEVHRPGTFSYKGKPSVLDMLMRAGGVTRYAGIEQIRVIQNGEPFPFNMREFLDTGQTGLLPEIKPGDVIFVPQASEQVEKGSRTVYIMGEVFKPGAMEMKDDTGFYDILATAGGPTRFAETRQIRIIRADGQVSAFDLQSYVDGNSDQGLPTIFPGDAILVPEKTDMNEKSWLKIHPNRSIRIMGAVNRPGRYEWADEMGLMDIIAHAGGPTAKADTSHLQVLSSDDTQQVSSTEFDLKRFLERGGDLNSLPKLKAGDTVVMPELPQDPNDNRSQWTRQSSKSSIYIFGSVGAPGRYAFNRDLNLLDLLSAAQGPTPSADLTNIRIARRGGNEADVTKLNLNLYFETGDESLLANIQNEDVIYVPSLNKEWLQKPKERVVRVLGAVNRPGRYTFNDSMTVLDLLAEAGGPTVMALQDRISVVNRIDGEVHARRFDLVKFAKSGNFTNLPVIRAGDTLYIPSKEQSAWYQFLEGLKDLVTVASFAVLVGL